MKFIICTKCIDASSILLCRYEDETSKYKYFGKVSTQKDIGSSYFSSSRSVSSPRELSLIRILDIVAFQAYKIKRIRKGKVISNTFQFTSNIDTDTQNRMIISRNITKSIKDEVLENPLLLCYIPDEGSEYIKEFESYDDAFTWFKHILKNHKSPYMLTRKCTNFGDNFRNLQLRSIVLAHDERRHLKNEGLSTGNISILNNEYKVLDIMNDYLNNMYSSSKTSLNSFKWSFSMGLRCKDIQTFEEYIELATEMTGIEFDGVNYPLFSNNNSCIPGIPFVYLNLFKIPLYISKQLKKYKQVKRFTEGDYKNLIKDNSWYVISLDDFKYELKRIPRKLINKNTRFYKILSTDNKEIKL